ncbi:hypothetical protein HDU76_005512, partial [Blyttiomyces sp. JEL0837]
LSQGYGDEVPRTPAGKIVMVCVMICSLFVIAFPLSMITMQYGHVVRVFVERQKAQAEAMRRLKSRVDQVRLNQLLKSQQQQQRGSTTSDAVSRRRFSLSLASVTLPSFKRAYLAAEAEVLTPKDSPTGGAIDIRQATGPSMLTLIEGTGGPDGAAGSSGSADGGSPGISGSAEVAVIVAEDTVLDEMGTGGGGGVGNGGITPTPATPSSVFTTGRGRLQSVVKAVSASLGGLNRVRAKTSNSDTWTPSTVDEFEMTPADNLVGSAMTYSPLAFERGSLGGGVDGSPSGKGTFKQIPLRKALTLDSAIAEKFGLAKTPNVDRGKSPLKGDAIPMPKEAQNTPESSLTGKNLESPEPAETDGEDFAFPSTFRRGTSSKSGQEESPPNPSQSSSDSAIPATDSIPPSSLGDPAVDPSALRQATAGLEIIKPGVKFAVPPKRRGSLQRADTMPMPLSTSASSGFLSTSFGSRGTPTPVVASTSLGSMGGGLSHQNRHNSSTDIKGQSQSQLVQASNSHGVSVREVERHVDVLLAQHPQKVHLRVSDWRLEYREDRREDLLRMRINCKDEETYRRLMKMLAEFH